MFMRSLIPAVALALAFAAAAPAPAPAQDMSFGAYVEQLRAKARAARGERGHDRADDRRADAQQPGDRARSRTARQPHAAGLSLDGELHRQARRCAAHQRRTARPVAQPHRRPASRTAVRRAGRDHDRDLGPRNELRQLSRIVRPFALACHAGLGGAAARAVRERVPGADEGWRTPAIRARSSSAAGPARSAIRSSSPSVYLRLATDGDGDGRANIFTDPDDTYASIANYFRDAGWQPGLPWGACAPRSRRGSTGRRSRPRSARPSARACTSATRGGRRFANGASSACSLSGRCPTTRSPASSSPTGRGAPAWLLTGNYRVILEYNCSNYYAMSVGLLADEIAR